MRGVPKGDNVEYVPQGRYFVMGDNVTVSRDSRLFGAVPQQWVYGVLIEHKKPQQVKKVKMVRGRPIPYEEAYKWACNILGIKEEK